MSRLRTAALNAGDSSKKQAKLHERKPVNGSRVVVTGWTEAYVLEICFGTLQRAKEVAQGFRHPDCGSSPATAKDRLCRDNPGSLL